MDFWLITLHDLLPLPPFPLILPTRVQTAEVTYSPSAIAAAKPSCSEPATIVGVQVKVQFTA